MDTAVNFDYLADKIESLAGYRNILTDPVIKALLALLRTDEKQKPVFCGEFYAELLKAHELNRFYTSNLWKNHILNLIIWADNPVTRQAAIDGSKLSSSWVELVRYDLHILQELFNLDNLLAGLLPLTLEGFDLKQREFKHHQLTQKLVKLMLNARDWSQELQLLLEHYHKLGVGLFGKYAALSWDGRKQELVGVENRDEIRFSELFGYEYERKQVIDNTVKFLQGYPANNVLLYGDRGTGKSSTVKALLNEFEDEKLRIVELKKSDLQDFNLLVRKLVTLPYKFIIFLDDLSFEEHEVEYKALKAAFEGGLETKPCNLLVYATSNRRHLIRESFAQREDDIHQRDTIEEKMSLADRFGLQIAFTSPDQELYLHIVHQLAKQRNILIEQRELEKKALQWELRHSGRSGRVARQFIDHLEGQED